VIADRHVVQEIRGYASAVFLEYLELFDREQEVFCRCYSVESAILCPELLNVVWIYYDKANIQARTSTMMRQGRFPRSRSVGGGESEGGQNQKVAWLSDEVDAWLTELPVRRLKGD
jgi:predicted DNA-binding transcriptional regulator AlpA